MSVTVVDPPAAAPQVDFLDRSNKVFGILAIAASLFLGAAGGYAAQVAHNTRLDTLADVRGQINQQTRADVDQLRPRVSAMEARQADQAAELDQIRTDVRETRAGVEKLLERGSRE